MSLIIKCKFIHISLVFTRALFLFQDTTLSLVITTSLLVPLALTVSRIFRVLMNCVALRVIAQVFLWSVYFEIYMSLVRLNNFLFIYLRSFVFPFPGTKSSCS